VHSPECRLVVDFAAEDFIFGEFQTEGDGLVDDSFEGLTEYAR
jgi:hypothetical protein